MLWFLLIYFGIYGSMQFFIFWKVRRAFPEMGWLLLAPAAFLLLMMFLPMLTHQIETRGWTGLARAAALTGYIWMAVSMWFFFIGLGGEAWNLAARLAALVRGAEPGLLIPPRAFLAAAGGLIAVLIGWGLIEASLVRLNEVIIISPRLPAGAEPVRIVQISDLHLSLITSRARIAKMVALIREAEPDLLVSTGDLCDSTGPEMDYAAGLLAELDPPLGKLAVTGNHEFYRGIEATLAFHRAAGFEVLRGEWTEAGQRLSVAGVDDPAGGRTGGAVFIDEDRALPPAGRGRFTVLLKHQPRVRAESLDRFDLQLSGHVHGGQIFPFRLVVMLFSPYMDGRHQLKDGRTLLVSRGAGTWGPPLRVLTPPEITLIIVKPAGNIEK